MKMFLWIFILGIPVSVKASMCFERTVEERLEQSDVLFIGVVDSIVTQSNVYTWNSNYFRKYINVQVVKSAKGLKEDISMVSIFYRYRINHYISIGDTIVFFAYYTGNSKRIYDPNYLMLGCGTDRLSQFSKKDITDLEALTWKQHKKVGTNKPIRESWFPKNKLLLFLLTSVVLNLFFGFYWIKRKKQGSTRFVVGNPFFGKNDEV